MMAKIGRNDPCPCGSGQKYKRCCLPRDEAAAAARATALAHETERFAPDAAEDDGLDEASNVVIDLIDAGRLDEAEHAAQDLLKRYPEVHDGLERLAMVAVARGDRLSAAEYYRKAADFVHAHADQYGLRWRSICESGRLNSAHPLTEGQAIMLREGAKRWSIANGDSPAVYDHQEPWPF
jgi:tetratricopeptide (TPR) repeat protein